MRIYLSSAHRYPASLYGVAAHSVQEDLALGLAELDHEVYLQINNPVNVQLPAGIKACGQRPQDIDICHLIGYHESEPKDLPWVRTNHSFIETQGFTLARIGKQDIAVSAELARLHCQQRFVHNGINPAKFIFNNIKQDYFLFISGTVSRAKFKGLQIAFDLAKYCNLQLKVAAKSDNQKQTLEFSRLCSQNGAEYIGHICGHQKAMVIANAKALLAPTQIVEAFGLVIAEAMVSGTPVIASDYGAIPEILPSQCGFVCSEFTDYINAVDQISGIVPETCREFAMKHYHYHTMAHNYLLEYEKEINCFINPQLSA